MKKRLFYTELAKHYDKIYHNVDYEKQIIFFEKLIGRYKKTPSKKILDSACGTGTHVGYLEKLGFEVTGLDISEEMLNEARKKNPKVNFLHGDIKKFQLKDTFGTIICFFNSILYCNGQSEIQKCLANFFSHLENGGVLIFDMVDKSIGVDSSKERGREYAKKDIRISFKPQWIYNHKKKNLDLMIDFVINGKTLHDHHIMGAFSINELIKIAEKVGFKVSVFQRQFDSIKKHNGVDNTAIFVCTK